MFKKDINKLTDFIIDSETKKLTIDLNIGKDKSTFFNEAYKYIS